MSKANAPSETQPRPDSVNLNTSSSETKAQPKRLINLLRGWPSPSLLPASLLRAAANRVLSDPAIAVPALQYAPDPGYQPLRESLAEWLGECYGGGFTTTHSKGGVGKEGEERGDGGVDVGKGKAEKKKRVEVKVKVKAEEIAITGGASQGLACVLQSFADPGYTRAVWAVAPCYFLACPVFEDAGFAGRLRAVPEVESGDGVDLEVLERGIREVDEEAERQEREEREKGVEGRRKFKEPGLHRKVYRHVVYLVATSANPSGKTMSIERRERLVRLARKYDALVISDDVYDFLQWPVTSSSSSSPLPTGPILPTLSQIDLFLPHDNPTTTNTKSFGNAISNASFSKLAGPGMRTGWIHASPDFIHGFAQTGSNRSGGAASQIAAAMAHQSVVSGELEGWLRDTVRPGLRRRHALILRAVREELEGLGVRIEGDEGNGDEDGEKVFGGYFIWLRLPEGIDAEEVAVRAREEEELIVAPGRLFEVKGDEESARFPGRMRLCFSWEAEGDVVEGVRRLGRVLRRMLEGAGERGVRREKESEFEQELQMAC